MLRYNRNRARGRFFPLFSPRELFYGSVPGAWYDPTDVNVNWRVNLLTYTEQFDNAAWVKSNVSISANSSVAPDGTSSGDTFVESVDAVPTSHYTYQQPSFTAGQPYSFSVYAKAIAANRLVQIYAQSGTVFARAIFNLNTGAVFSNDFGTATITDAGSGWYRLTVTGTPSTTGSGYVFVVSKSSTGLDYIGNGSSVAYLWGAQLQTGSTATTYQQIVTPEITYAATQTTNLFQDSTGTTPVWAVEQPVGLILDKSQGLVLGPELVTNGDFSGGITGWIAGNASWSVGGGKASNDGTNVVFASFRQNNVVTAGTFYLVEWDQVTTAGDLRLWFNGVQLIALSVSGTGRKSYRVQCTSTGSLFFEASVGAVLSIDNVTVKALPGNHASQSTAASRPTYRARYNLLTYSEQFENATWIKFGGGTGVAPVVTANAGTAPDGTLTADSIAFNRGAGNLITDQSTIYQAPTVVNGSHTQTIWLKAATPSDIGKQLGLRNVAGSSYLAVTLTADWVRYTRVETGSSANFEIANRGTITTGNSVTALVWGAQLLTAADVTATGNAYQRIAAATVYDTAPIFRPYLAFDGVDDSLATAAINFTSTDKMSVFSGVTKLSDAALGNVVELGNRNLIQAGSFSMNAPRFAGSPNYAFIVEGTAVTDNTITGYPAPITNVMTGRADISAPLNQLRVNGAVAGTLTTTLGTGNFGTWPLFIGRRNNSTFPFNGRLYSLIVRGAASSVTEIADTELWVNARTGAY